MAFKVGVGKSNFADLRNSGNYYVDKTELIYELVEKTDNEVTLFTRPRRFGKTLMMSMMEYFFNIRKNSKPLFEGLEITKHKTFCKEYMNQYPVLFVSFKDVEAENFDDAYDMLRVRLADIGKSLADLAENSNVNKYDSEVLDRLQAEKSTPADVRNSLKTIMRMLYATYGKQVILLIDEYDVPLAKASEGDIAENRYYSKMLDVIQGIMGTALKDNEFLKFAVVTGCLRIAKESIFTGANNFASYSVLDERFSNYFGFLENEVEALLTAADRSEAREEIKEWYDGYVFGNSYVYCPWDVINHVSSLCFNRESKPKNYWKNTSHNSILLTFVKRTDFDVADKFEALLNGGTIVQTISDELTYDTLHSSEDNLWSVLLMTGYVTKADPQEEGEEVSLKIPNREIASIFKDTVVEHFKQSVDTTAVRNLINALWDRDTTETTRIVSELLWDTISYYDYNEDYYHAFLAGIFVGRGYLVDSNKEKGLGRPDILIKDKKNRRAIIIEAKLAKKGSGLDKACDEAIKQIITEKYAEEIIGYEQVICYGVGFYKKQAKFKLLTKQAD
ncbi:MAG: ATP-binding protein [Lachnospiraceae bacterium]|nr:ATP-binding protein [Lachnospiraceae bacterium]